MPIMTRTRSISVEDVRRFHARIFRADRAMLVIAGGLDPARARKAVEDVFGSIPLPAKGPDRVGLRPAAGPFDVRWDASTRHLFLA